MANNFQKRFLLFIFGCIVVRFALVYMAIHIPMHYLPWMGVGALILSISWFYLFFTCSRTTGAEVFGDKIWWTNIRPVHAILWGLFAWCAFQKQRKGWIFLLVDVLFGLVSFFVFHMRNGDF